MPFSLDTNIVIALIGQKSPAANLRLQQVRNRGHDVSISAIVTHELRFGAELSADPAGRHTRLDNFFLGPFRVLRFEEDDAREAAGIRALLRKAGTPIGPYDVLIAGQARRHGLTLVTANVREFERVPGLAVENWL